MRLSLFFLIASSAIIATGCVDDEPLTDKNGNAIGTYRIACGPSGSSSYTFADGIVAAAGETFGIFMSKVSTGGSLENIAKLVSGDSYLGDAYMALVQEDTYEFLRKDCVSKFNADPDSVNTQYLKAASRTKVLLSLYTETVYLLVNKSSSISSVSDITTGHDVNLGPVNSGTYITASNILSAWEKTAHTSHNDTEADSVQKVVSGEYDAAFFLDSSPCTLLKSVAANANVKLIKVQMPAQSKTYSEDGTILAKDYPFQSGDINGTVSVKTLLVGGPNFNDKHLNNFLTYVFDKAKGYAPYNQKWEDLSLALSQSYMRANPEKCNFRAICYAAGFPEPDPLYVEDKFFTDYGVSAYHDMYVELDYLLSLNTGISLKESNTTGTWENAYRLMRGEGLMALVQDDVFEYLKRNDDMYDSMIAASMRKLVPLQYEYVHLLVYDDPAIPDVPDLTAILAAASDVNVGPKTSGTFMTAMEIIKTYTVNENITYHFDEPSVAVGKVQTGEYDAAFIVSGAPYNKFYSHDTWNITDSLGNCKLISASFKDTTPYPYKMGVLAGNSTNSENYPYKPALLAADVPTVRVRALQVVSNLFEASDIDVYLKSVFRKAYYMTVPPDLDFTSSGSFKTNPLWIPIHKESMTAAEAAYPIGEYTSTYGEDVEGAMEYFVNNPFGWHDAAADYYVSLFSE